MAQHRAIASNSPTKCLTDGLIEIIKNDLNDRLNPIVQILAINRLRPKRILATIFDGKRKFATCMLASEQIDNDFNNGKLSKYTVIVMDEYIVGALPYAPDTKVIMVKKLAILKDGMELNRELNIGERFTISNPSFFNNQNLKISQFNNSQSLSKPPKPPSLSTLRNNVYTLIINEVYPHEDYDQIVDNFFSSNRRYYRPINHLTPYNYTWTIRCRVLRKSPIQSYNNARGSGKFFKFEVKDDTGSISCVAFNEECDKFFNKIKERCNYYISGGKINPTNPRYASAKYEIILNWDTRIVPTHEKLSSNVSDLPSFKFVKISRLSSIQVGTLVDIIAIIRNVNPVESKFCRNSSKEVPMRIIHLIDNSKAEVQLTLWKERAVQFSGQPGQIIALKDVAVKEFNGKQLSTFPSTYFEIDINLPEAQELKRWYQTEGRRKNFSLLAKPQPIIKLTSVHICQIYSKMQHNIEDQHFFTISGTVFDISEANYHFYQACIYGCLKKVEDQNGKLYCTKCNRTSSEFKSLLKMNIQICDPTGSIRFTLFNGKHVEQMFGKTEAQLVSLFTNDPNAYNNIVKSIQYRQFEFNLTAKWVTIKDVRKISLSLSSINEQKNRANALFNVINAITRQ